MMVPHVQYSFIVYYLFQFSPVSHFRFFRLVPRTHTGADKARTISGFFQTSHSVSVFFVCGLWLARYHQITDGDIVNIMGLMMTSARPNQSNLHPAAVWLLSELGSLNSQSKNQIFTKYPPRGHHVIFDVYSALLSDPHCFHPHKPHERAEGCSHLSSCYLSAVCIETVSDLYHDPQELEIETSKGSLVQI